MLITGGIIVMEHNILFILCFKYFQIMRFYLPNKYSDQEEMRILYINYDI